MHRYPVLLCLCLEVWVKYAAASDWCYTGCAHTPSTWPELPGSSCGGTAQSPIDIVTGDVHTDPGLLDFTFVGFLRQRVASVTNNGHTVNYGLEQSGVTIGGGGLNGSYTPIQLHFHWGDTQYHPGSEHTIDGERYPVEMHVVSLKTGLTMAQALADPQGIAVLGFFINATDDAAASGPWRALTSYLTNVTDAATPVNKNISINDLIGTVDLSRFYRYAGSLTTPNCTQAVVWTVFHEPININVNLVRQFPAKTGLTNVYRPTQALNSRRVSASPATPLPPSGHEWCYGACANDVSHWDLLPGSSCGATRQSPVDIDARAARTDGRLDAFTLTNFSSRSAFASITNTGHTVTCGLRDSVVEVSGGGLGHVYAALQLHFHWGTAHASGSEHTVDSKRYLMEMHVVSKRKDLSLAEANHNPSGFAVLAFFIEASSTSIPASVTHAWSTLTSYLPTIQNKSSSVELSAALSIDDLLGDVDRDSYYRYNGSLTTPLCNQAVVWTVFKESIKVDRKLLTTFPDQMGYYSVFRPAQPLNGRTIYTTGSASASPGPVAAYVLLACLRLFV
ncbi:carbonic anhydrase 4-like [Betta splendens]|uniref:Carbonic anhydrase n=1 Tax=Betta splendens TaxID=158456 RepID=A0A6P7L9A4_BETSP|nr:carbonic anhydrase 4-like [Betta splendens]XP_028991077.1 carbonic anhydrase 4-like [Betta splendens]